MQANFTFAENITFSSDNKVIVFGFFPDSQVTVQPGPVWAEPTPEKPIFLPQLAIMATINGAQPGNAGVSVTIDTPLGKFPHPLAENAVGQIGANGKANINFQFSPFPVMAFGQYTVHVALQGETFEGTFEILKIPA